MANQASEKTKQAVRPPYPSYTSFRNYIKKLGETVVPSQIDRSVFGNQSGTYISLMIGAFEWFDLVDRNGKPTQTLHNLVSANESEYKAQLKQILINSYEILSEEKIDLKTGTEAQISKLFRDYGYSGSTLTKAVSFFLSSCKDAGFEVGDHMRAPAPPRAAKSGGKKGKTNNKAKQEEDSSINTPPPSGEPEVPEGMEKITISLRGMEDGIIFFPAGLEGEDARRAVNAAVFNLKSYYELD